VQTSSSFPVAGRAGRSTKIRDRRDRVLLRRYARSRDPRLREELVARFMPLAHSLANRYRTSAEPIEDLTQVASEGLVRAIDGYDPERRNSFSSYAAPVILGALRHHFRDATVAVHVPRGLGERIQKVRGAEQRLTDGSEGAARTEQLAEITGLSADEVEEAVEADQRRRPLSTDRTVRRQGADAEDGSVTLLDSLGTEESGYDAVESSIASNSADLSGRERRVLMLRFEHGLKQREIGERIGVSQMQVSRLLRSALRKLLNAVRGGRRPLERTEGEEAQAGKAAA
jgi:RNA polymerase sigma-B factor